MNKRLVWNFEIKSGNRLQLPLATVGTPSETYWESRFFWPEKHTIVLSGLDEYFLDLSCYKIIHRVDCYNLLPDSDANIKKRCGEWFYKPLIQRTSSAVQYGKKIKLEIEHRFFCKICFTS